MIPPKFSIIIPVYNVAPYLRECLDSVLAQTFTDWEAICVDDGSTDGSGAILDEYAAKDQRFKVVHQKNAGVGAARNAGLEIAKGEWICFADGDDALLPSAFEILDGVTSRRHPDIIMYSYIRDKFSHGVPKVDVSLSGSHEIFVDSEYHAREAFRTFAGSLLAWNACYSRRALGNLRFRDFCNGEDVLWGVSALVRSQHLMKINASLYCYRIGREGSAVNQKVTIRRIASACGVVKAIVREVRSWDYAIYISEGLSCLVIGLLSGTVKAACAMQGDEQLRAKELLFDVVEDVRKHSGSLITGRFCHEIDRSLDEHTLEALRNFVVRHHSRVLYLSRMRGMTRLRKLRERYLPRSFVNAWVRNFRKLWRRRHARGG